jgi:hypothetical protein
MITKYNDYINKNILLERVMIDSDDLLDEVNVDKISFSSKPFNFDINKYGDDYKLEQLRNNPDFNDNLSKNELFISELNDTSDFDLFILDNFKYILIHKRKDRSLDKLEKLGQPLYIIIQTKDINGEWKRDNINLYKVNDKFGNFYKKINSKTIKINSDGQDYIYSSNGKRSWILKNIEKKNDKFKDIMTSDEILDLVKKNIDVKIM